MKAAKLLHSSPHRHLQHPVRIRAMTGSAVRLSTHMSTVPTQHEITPPMMVVAMLTCVAGDKEDIVLSVET